MLVCLGKNTIVTKKGEKMENEEKKVLRIIMQFKRDRARKKAGALGVFLSAVLSLGAGGISFAPEYVLSSEVSDLRRMVYDYAAALATYDANAKAQYVLQEARFAESQRIKNLNAEGAALLDKIREQMRRELSRVREQLETNGDRVAAIQDIERILIQYRVEEKKLKSAKGSYILTSSRPVKKD